MPTIRYIKSNNERAISKLENDFVKVCALRFPTSTVMLKMFPMIPTHDTERKYKAWSGLLFIKKLTRVLIFCEVYIYIYEYYIYNKQAFNEYNHKKEVVVVYLGIYVK